jgi:hypothetical protein
MRLGNNHARTIVPAMFKFSIDELRAISIGTTRHFGLADIIEIGHESDRRY